MGIPVFLSQVVAATTDTLQVAGGSLQTLNQAIYFFFQSPKGLDSDGKSLLYELKQKTDASGGATWTYVLDANLKLRITHNGGGSIDIAINCGLAWNLGVLVSYPPDVTATVTVTVPAGAGGYTAPYRSPWLWCPEMHVSSTGPSLFDPMVSPGIRTSAGSASRAPDSTPSYTKNGEQIEAWFIFTAVEAMYRAREPDLTFGGDTHEREAYETWWRLGPSEGRRFLFWRDKAKLISVSRPDGSDSDGLNYVEYAPSEAMRAAPEVQPTAPENLYWWNVTVRAWATENGTRDHLG